MICKSEKVVFIAKETRAGQKGDYFLYTFRSPKGRLLTLYSKFNLDIQDLSECKLVFEVSTYNNQFQLRLNSVE